MNLQIASHPWRFDTARLDALRAIGMPFADATLDSVARCQNLFIRESKQIGEFIAANQHSFSDRCEQIERSGIGNIKDVDDRLITRMSGGLIIFLGIFSEEKRHNDPSGPFAEIMDLETSRINRKSHPVLLITTKAVHTLARGPPGCALIPAKARIRSE